MNPTQDALDGMAETFAIFIESLTEMELVLNTMTNIAYEQSAITGQKPTDYSAMLAMLDVLQSKVEMTYYRKRDGIRNLIDIKNLDAPDHCDQL